MTNLEGRVIVRRRASPPPDGVRTDLEILTAWPRRWARAPWFPSSSDARMSSTSCAARPPAAPADYSGITYDRDRRTRTACSGPARRPITPARRGSSPSDSPRLPAGARFHATPHASHRRSPRRRLSAAPHDRPGARPLSVRHSDASLAGTACAPRRRTARGNPSRRRRARRRRRRRCRAADDAARDGDVQSPPDPNDSRRHRVRALSLERRRSQPTA